VSAPPVAFGFSIAETNAQVANLHPRIETSEVLHHVAKIKAGRNAVVRSERRATSSLPFVPGTVEMTSVSAEQGDAVAPD